VGDQVSARLAAGGHSGKLASIAGSGHKRGMRRLLPFAALLAAACAPRPAPEPTPQPPASAPAAPKAHDHSTLDGMTANDLVQHFGKPRLQVREGDSAKLQFTGPNCVLDAYLYPSPSGQGVPRVTHVDTRNFQGADVNTQGCIASIEGR
jgi:hypothetical protein